MLSIIDHSISKQVEIEIQILFPVLSRFGCKYSHTFVDIMRLGEILGKEDIQKGLWGAYKIESHQLESLRSPVSDLNNRMG